MKQLTKLLNRAKSDGESNIHILVESERIKKYPAGPFYRTEVKFYARYWHGKDERKEKVLNISVKSRDYSHLYVKIPKIQEEIIKKGFQVKTIRKRHWGSRGIYRKILKEKSST